jgi:hypothetical protein
MATNDLRQASGESLGQTARCLEAVSTSIRG